VFTDKLWASRTTGLARYQSLAARYATEFEARWADGTVPEGAPLLGTSDIQSMADLDHTVKDVKEMRWITVGPRMLTMMTVAGIGPFCPFCCSNTRRRPGAEVLVETDRPMTGSTRRRVA